MDITGKIKQISSIKQVSERFRSKEFVITDNSSQYPQHLTFQLTQDRVSLIDNYNEGDDIKVHFNLRGREWTSPSGELKHFNTLEAWKLEGKAWSKPVEKNNQQSSVDNSASQNDDLPF